MEYLELDQEHRDVLAAVGDALSVRRAQALDGLHRALEAAVPGHLLMPEREELESMEANVVAICTMLQRGASHHGTPTEALEASRLAARLGLSEADMSRVYSYGQDVLWLEQIQPLLAETCSSQESLVRCSRIAFSMLSEFLTRVEREVSDQLRRELLRRGSPAQRIDVVRSVLAGQDPGADVLGYRVSGRHLAMIFWSPVGKGADPATVLAEATEVLRALPAGARLVVQASARTAYGWVAVRPGQHIDLADLEAATKGRSSVVHVASGSAGRGLDGFRASLEEAQRAHDFVTRSSGPIPAVTTYDRIALVSLLLNDREQAEAFARRHLHDLTASTTESRDLRRTALTYLGVHRSTARTAEILHLHRNTVNNRIRRVEAILGYPLSDSGLELHVALMVFQSIESDGGPA